jgi:N6-adenosine-specific RNA methylase IME4/ParB-like chromosome segregation protein Spo0J
VAGKNSSVKRLHDGLRAVHSIKVGKRHRKDIGDIDALARSISENGLLHPIVVDKDNNLVAGERRLEAVKQLGWKDVRVTAVDIDDIARGEFAENMDRKDFTLSEAVAIKRALEPLEKAAAKERQGARTDKHPGKLPTGSKGRAADKAAKATGMARRTLEKAEAIVDAAESEPQKFGKLKEDMDRTGRVNGVYRRLKVAKQAEIIRAELPPLPNRGPYRVIVVDPPWPYEKRVDDPSHRAVLPYPPLSIEQICAVDVAGIAHEDCILWLWTTNSHMRASYAVLDAWGFQSKTILTWAKDRMGTGDWLRGQTEHCHFAVRGNPTVTLTNQTTLLRAAVRAHSEKPEEFYKLVETLCPASRYAYLFSRSNREKWDCHGDEVPALLSAAKVEAA